MLTPAVLLSILASSATAFPMLDLIPGAFEGGAEKRQAIFSQDKSNCGAVPCLVFNAKDQYVDVTDKGLHPFIKPGAGDIRGLCPGLNAAANHGFLPRNGLPNIQNTIDGLGQAYNMNADLAGFLAVVAIVLTGDYVTQTWSIGGTFPVNPLDGLLSQPGGISNSHNKYEGDASVARGDAYLNGGDATILKIDKFTHMYNQAPTITFPSQREHNKWVHDQSVSTNPYYFSAPFSGLVAPAAHQFIVNFMSNHSAANPEGVLTKEVLKSFYAIEGQPGSFKHNRGQERIPLNWYRRPTTDQHDAAKVFLDLAYTASKYPEILQFGGNTGKVNSFAGVNLGDLTGGVYNSQNIFKGNNLGCFTFQAFEAVLPDTLAGLVKNVAAATALVNKYLDPLVSKLNCPQLTKYNQGLFNQFPGYTYHPAPVSK